MDPDLAYEIQEALVLGEGYVVIQLDPDGPRVTPVKHPNPNTEVGLRRLVRMITRTVWEQGKAPLVAAVLDGGEDTLPSSANPSSPALTSFFDTSNEQLA